MKKNYLQQRVLIKSKIRQIWQQAFIAITDRLPFALTIYRQRQVNRIFGINDLSTIPQNKLQVLSSGRIYQILPIQKFKIIEADILDKQRVKDISVIQIESQMERPIMSKLYQQFVCQLQNNLFYGQLWKKQGCGTVTFKNPDHQKRLLEIYSDIFWQMKNIEARSQLLLSLGQKSFLRALASTFCALPIFNKQQREKKFINFILQASMLLYSYGPVRVPELGQTFQCYISDYQLFFQQIQPKTTFLLITSKELTIYGNVKIKLQPGYKAIEIIIDSWLTTVFKDGFQMCGKFLSASLNGPLFAKTDLSLTGQFYFIDNKGHSIRSEMKDNILIASYKGNQFRFIPWHSISWQSGQSTSFQNPDRKIYRLIEQKYPLPSQF